MPLRALVLLALLPGTLFAQEAKDAANAKPAAELQPRIETDVSDANVVETHGRVTVGGTAIDYTARAGTLKIQGEDGKAKADVFFVAYTKDDADPTQRPITFCFNGGPGSSSVWLHLGLVGPQRVELDDPHATPPPGRLVPNEFSLLGVTDVVLIDPVSTGYSRPDDEKEKSKFHGYQEDLRSVGEFLHLFTTKYGRWGSRKYLLGESYGTLRAAGLAGHLRERYRMELNGIVLISSVLDFRTLSFGDDELPYVGFLPSYTATAWYHGALSKERQAMPLRELLDEAEAFAAGDYALALLKGDALVGRPRRQVVRRYAELTGLPAAYVERAHLKVSMSQFAKRLLLKRGETVGRFDSRYKGPSLSGTSSGTGYDPSAAALFGPFTAAMNAYLRDGLDVRRDDVYEILTGKVHPWNYENFGTSPVSSTDTLREAMIENPHLKVLVANGYYDLATPYFATEYTFDHLHLPGELRDNVTLTYYEAGHMMYVHPASLEKLHADLEEFYTE
jgi:carboxypeptidase C (cathepsin A)